MNRAVAIVAASLLSAGTASAYPLYWIGTQVRGGSFPWQYSGLGTDGKPYSGKHVTVDAVRTAIAATFTAFDAGGPKDAAGKACSTLFFREVTPPGGATERNDQSDRKNTEGIFVTLASDPTYQYMQGGAIAFANPSTDPDSYVNDCDTVYNAVDEDFASDGDKDSIDLQGVAMQETAHCFGLHHVCQQSRGDGQPPCNGPDVDFQSVMFPFAQTGFTANLPDGRDQDNFCQIYPVNGIGRPCDGADLNGFTVPDCGPALDCQCTDVGKICTAACSATQACPSGSVCGQTGFCLPDFYPGTASKGVPTRTSLSCDTNGVSHKPMGAVCKADADCGLGETCETSVPGGYCTVASCGGTCPGSAVCVGREFVAAGTSACLRTCTYDAATCASIQCEKGQQCQPLGQAGQGVCWASCKTDHDCEGAAVGKWTCDKVTGACFKKTATAACGSHPTPDAGTDPGPCKPNCEGLGCYDPDGCGGLCNDAAICHPSNGADAGATAGASGTGHSSGGCFGSHGALAAALVFLGFRRRRRVYDI